VTYDLYNVAPKQTITEQISMKVKKSISNDSISINDKSYNNLVINVAYGNATNIHVNGPFNKYYEININNKLPAVDSKTSFAIGSLILVIMLYFLLRVIVIRSEIKNIKLEHSSLSRKKNK
jgi:hypothetical protein